MRRLVAAHADLIAAVEAWDTGEGTAEEDERLSAAVDAVRRERGDFRVAFGERAKALEPEFEASGARLAHLRRSLQDHKVALDPIIEERVLAALSNACAPSVLDADLYRDLLSRLVHAVYDCNEFGVHAAIDDVVAEARDAGVGQRCPICDWPIEVSIEKGCTPGNCSYKPPHGSAEYERIRARREQIAKRPASQLEKFAVGVGAGLDPDVAAVAAGGSGRPR